LFAVVAVAVVLIGSRRGRGSRWSLEPKRARTWSTLPARGALAENSHRLPRKPIQPRTPLMQRSHDRILTTHTGSLPRPPHLTRLYARRARGEEVDEGEIERTGHAALQAIVPKQIEAGIDIGNNGEQQREGFFLHVRHRMSGFGGSWKRWPRADVERYPVFKKALEQQNAGKEMVSNFEPPKAIGEIRYTGAREARQECVDFRNVLSARKSSGKRGFVEAFLTAPSPGIVVAAIRNEYYDTEDAYLAAVGKALQVEYEAIIAQGFLLQLDCPDLALEHHISFQDRPLSDFLGFVERVVATINEALRDIPREQVRMHVCWGNYEAPHDSDVPLANILPLIARMNVGALVLPFANPRHAHEVRCLEGNAIHPDQLVVSGVIDSTTNFVEHPEVVAERIERVASALGDPSRVIAGTDCGFDTAAGAGRVAEDVVWAKLTALSEGARLASGRLFPKA
jgi:5-methyltetrahydropteroyltriglutamate--homocysteine methyltransferase